MAQFYPEEVIQEVRAANDIVDIVSEYVKLKRVGNRFTGLCPFHKEKTPSFTVSPDKQLYYCFGCGAGGTVVQFIMAIERIDFIEAIKLLAERAKIRLPEGDYRGDEAKRFEKKQLILKINTEAARFFYRCLHSQEGENGRKYLRKRMINPKTATSFGLGYAPDSWDALIQYLKEKGYAIQDILDAGLIIENKNKNTYYDRFRNRIMFPIIDLRGNVIGFGGRVLDDSLPKYLNSPETVVFNKSRTLYGLNFAKNANKNELIIVEGYMDVISLHQNGIINTVASLGTAFTHEQAKLIKKFCQEAIIAYDSDAAGQAATLRGMDILTEEGCRVKILSLSEGKDPDEFIRTKGAEKFEKAIRESKSLIEYKINLLKAKYDINDIVQKVDFVTELANIFAKIDNAVERDAYIQKISEETKISSQAILAEIKKIISKNAGKGNKSLKNIREIVPEPVATVKNSSENNIVNTRLINAERMLINVLCYDKFVFNKVRELIRPDDFSDDLHVKIATIIYALREKDEAVDPAQIVSRFEGEEIKTATSIFQIEPNFEDNLKAAVELIETINKEKNMQKIKISLKEGNVEKLHTLLIEYKQK